jgi:uncharacterized protein related to proFAR isomerase
VEPGTFELVPAVHIQRNRVVHPGDLSPLEGPKPAERIRELAAKGLVCVVDHDGLQRNRANLDTLRRGAEKGNVWADAGSRFATDAMDLLVAGAERATLRWATLASEGELREAAEVSDSVVLGLEYNGPMVPNPVVQGDEGRALALARELGLGICVLDLARTGRGQGFDRSLASRFASTGLARWFGGGVRGGEEARELEAMGYAGALLEAAAEGGWR